MFRRYHRHGRNLGRPDRHGNYAERAGIKSIPINILRPIPGTPLEHQAALSEDEILRTIAIFRYINPTAMVRLAAGRNSMEHSGERAFRSGANAAITGDMLTTSGNRISEDQEMLAAMGFTL